MLTTPKSKSCISKIRNKKQLCTFDSFPECLLNVLQTWYDFPVHLQNQISLMSFTKPTEQLKFTTHEQWFITGDKKSEKNVAIQTLKLIFILYSTPSLSVNGFFLKFSRSPERGQQPSCYVKICNLADLNKYGFRVPVVTWMPTRGRSALTVLWYFTVTTEGGQRVPPGSVSLTHLHKNHVITN